jgi:hypothetical protein
VVWNGTHENAHQHWRNEGSEPIAARPQSVAGGDITATAGDTHNALGSPLAACARRCFHAAGTTSGPSSERRAAWCLTDEDGFGFAELLAHGAAFDERGEQSVDWGALPPEHRCR